MAAPKIITINSPLNQIIIIIPTIIIPGGGQNIEMAVQDGRFCLKSKFNKYIYIYIYMNWDIYWDVGGLWPVFVSFSKGSVSAQVVAKQAPSHGRGKRF